MAVPHQEIDVIGLTWRAEKVCAGHSFIVGSQTWTVGEVLDPTTSTRVLIFEGPGIARRVRSYPPNWRELSNEALLALSWSR